MAEKKMLEKKFLDVFNAVMQNTLSHQKNERVLINIYKSMDFDDFVDQFMLGLSMAFSNPLKNKDPRVDTFLNFMASFVISMPTNHALRQIQEDEFIDRQSHPLFDRVIFEVLKYNNLESTEARYYSCHFIKLLLSHVADEICDNIKSCMLLRLEDHKPQIRQKAVQAMVRLQEPAAQNCAVFRGFLERFSDPDAAVRKEVVSNIAINAASVVKIIERIRDVDTNVRTAAFSRCAFIGPKFIRIVERQEILMGGFCETHPAAKKVFLNNVLPKWLSTYDGNILKFLHGIKLDADESDTQKTMILIERLLEVFFKTTPIGDIVHALDLNDEKLISPEKLTSEHATYWYLLMTYIQKNEEELGEYMENIFPELTQFCNYVEGFLKTKSNKSMELWEKLEYEQIVYCLFKIVYQSDFSDEVGRQTLIKLIKDVLTTYKFKHRILLQIIVVFHNILGDTNEVCNEVRDIITEMRETIVSLPVKENSAKKAENDYKKATLQGELLTLEDNQEKAINEQNCQLADDLHKRILEIKASLAVFDKPPPQVEVIKEVSNDPEMIGRCVDLLIALLSLPKLAKLNAPLKLMKAELLHQVQEERVAGEETELYGKMFRCLVLYSLLDKSIAQEHLKTIIIPIVIYRARRAYIKPTLILAIKGITDIIMAFGVEIFPKTDDKNTKKNGRRLYQIGDSLEIDESQEYSLEQVIDVMLDMLDDEEDDMREVAGTALAKMIIQKIFISPSLITRLFIKWFNPLTEKQDPILIQRFGEAFWFMAKQPSGDMDNVLEHAIIPTIEIVANAPKKSPLSDVNQDKMVQALTSLTNLERSNEISSMHKNLAYAACSKINAFPEDKCVYLLTKLLLALELPFEDPAAIKELQEQVELLLNDVKDRSVVRNLIKYQLKLKGTNARGAGEGDVEVTRLTEGSQLAESSRLTEQTEGRVVVGGGDNEGSEDSDEGSPVTTNEPVSTEKQVSEEAEKPKSTKIESKTLEDNKVSDNRENKTADVRRSSRLHNKKSNEEIRDMLLTLEKTILPLITKLRKHKKSPEDIYARLCETHPTIKEEKTQKNLTFAICNKIGKAPAHKDVCVLTKLLLSLNVPNDIKTVRELRSQVSTILVGVKERWSVKNLRTYLEKLGGSGKDVDDAYAGDNVDAGPSSGSFSKSKKSEPEKAIVQTNRVTRSKTRHDNAQVKQT